MTSGSNISAGSSPPPVFVTGSAGYVGTNLVRRLLDDGVPVRVLPRHEDDNRAHGREAFGCNVPGARNVLRDGGRHRPLPIATRLHRALPHENPPVRARSIVTVRTPERDNET